MVETEFSEQQEKFKKMHCTKTRETELIPESSVSLSLLDFQNYFKGRLRKKLVTQSSQFIELFSQWNCVLLYESAGFFVTINREHCGALKKIAACLFWLNFTISPQKDNSGLNTPSFFLKQQSFYGRKDKNLAKFLPWTET